MKNQGVPLMKIIAEQIPALQPFVGPMSKIIEGVVAGEMQKRLIQDMI